MNRDDIIESLSRNAGIPKIRAAHFVQLFQDTLKDTLAKGEKVTISDFGTFTVSQRRQFKGHKPKNGAIPPSRRIPVFRAGKQLKEALNGPGTEGLGVTPPPKRPIVDREGSDVEHERRKLEQPISAKETFAQVLKGRLTHAQAARRLGMRLIEFAREASRRGIPAVPYEPADLQQELQDILRRRPV